MSKSITFEDLKPYLEHRSSYEEIKKACDKHEVEIDVSISHVKDNAISTVVVKVNKE